MSLQTSDQFMDAFTNCGGTYSMNCGFCGRTHFTRLDTDYEELCEKESAEPDKYVKSSDDSIAWGYLDGRQYVWNCPCDAGTKYEKFLWSHKEQIVYYLKLRAKAELRRAEDNAKLVEGI